MLRSQIVGAKFRAAAIDYSVIQISCWIIKYSDLKEKRKKISSLNNLVVATRICEGNFPCNLIDNLIWSLPLFHLFAFQPNMCFLRIIVVPDFGFWASHFRFGPPNLAPCDLSSFLLNVQVSSEPTAAQFAWRPLEPPPKVKTRICHDRNLCRFAFYHPTRDTQTKCTKRVSPVSNAIRHWSDLVKLIQLRGRHDVSRCAANKECL